MIQGKPSVNSYRKIVTTHCLWLLIWVCPFLLVATPQVSPSDSLLSLLTSDQLSDFERMEIQGQLAESLRYSDPDLCFEYAERAYRLAQRLQLPHHEALYLRFMAVSRSIGSRHLASIPYHQQGIQLAESIGDTNLIYFHNNLGISLQELQDYEAALDHFQAAIRIADSIGTFRAGIPAMGMLANLHHTLEADSLALVYSKAAIRAAHEHHFPLMLGYGYKDQGKMYLALGHADSALQSLQFAEQHISPQNVFIQVDILIVRSEVYRSISRFAEAQEAAEEALKLAQRGKLTDGESRAEIALARALFETNQYDDALIHGLQALQLLKSRPVSIEQVELYHLLAKTVLAKGDARRAYNYEQQANLVLEEVRSRDREISTALAKQRMEMTTKSLLAEKEQAISRTVLEMWTNSQTFAWSMGIFAGVILLVFWLFFFRKREEGTEAIWHHLTDREIEKRIRFGKQLTLGNLLLLLPIAIYLLVWGAREWAMVQIGVLVFLGVVHVIISQRTYPYLLVGSMLVVYPGLGFLPILIAPLFSVLLTPIVAIIAFNYFSAKPWHIMLNCALFFLSFGFCFLVIRQLPAGSYPYYSENLDLMVMVILSLVIVSTLIFHNRHIAESKRELEDSRRFVEHLTDVNPHWLFAKDLEGRYMFANTAMAEHFGWTKEEMIGKTRSDLGTVAELIQLAGLEDEEILKKGQPMLKRIKKFYQEGEQPHWRQMIKKPLFNQQGEMIGLVGISSDITDRVVAEQNLKERDIMVGHILDSIPDPLLALNLKRQPILWNERIKRNLWTARNVDPSQPIDWENIYPKESVQRLDAVFQQVQEGKSIGFINVQEVLGKELVLDLNFAPILNSEEEITGVVMVGRDITEQQNQALALQKSQATYKTLFQNTFDAVLWYDYQEESLLDANDAARVLFELSEDENLARYHRYDFLPEYPPQMPDVDTRQASDDHREQILQGKSVQTEAVFHSTKGNLFEAEVTILPSGGNPGQALIVIRDVTEANQTYRELTERRKIYQSLIDLSFDGIDIVQLFFDPNQPNTYGGELLVRNEKMVKLLADETHPIIQAKEILRRSKPEQPGGYRAKALVKEKLQQLVQKRQIQCDWTLISPDGKEIEIDLVAHLIHVNGKTLLIRILKDITENKRQQSELRETFDDLQGKNAELKKYIESNMNLENFAYLASHDLKAPIRTVISFTQLLERSLGDRLLTQEREFLDFIISATQNMQQLVNDLLDYSRVNTTKLQVAEVAVGDILEELKRELQDSIDQSSAVIELGELPEMIYADRIKIRRLFQNLMTNSLKFSGDEDPLIRISGKEIEAGESWEFSVEDNGIGISEEYQDKIFMIFRRLDQKYEGTGIGLAMCKKIVEQHQGRIWVDSVVGEGSTFRFTIHRMPEAEVASATPLRLG